MTSKWGANINKSIINRQGHKSRQMQLWKKDLVRQLFTKCSGCFMKIKPQVRFVQHNNKLASFQNSLAGSGEQKNSQCLSKSNWISVKSQLKLSILHLKSIYVFLCHVGASPLASLAQTKGKKCAPEINASKKVMRPDWEKKWVTFSVLCSTFQSVSHSLFGASLNAFQRVPTSTEVSNDSESDGEWEKTGKRDIIVHESIKQPVLLVWEVQLFSSLLFFFF